MKLFFLFFIFTSCALWSPNPNREKEDSKAVPELKPFVTDYCSKWPNGSKEDPALWKDCCFRHDLSYWLGGLENQRIEADKKLKSCVKISSDSLNGFLMYMGVRFGGPPGDASWAWGFGWSHDRKYFELQNSDIEWAQTYLRQYQYKSKKEQALVLEFSNYLSNYMIKK